MKKHLFAITIGTLILTGCETSQIRSAIENAADSAVAKTINSSNSSSNTSTSSNSDFHSNNQHTLSKEDFSYVNPTKTISKFGNIRPIIAEKNSNGMTMFRVEMYQKDSGARINNGSGILYKVSPEGFLYNNDYEHISSSAEPINSGKYYLKVGTNTGNAADEVLIIAGVTNVIQVEVE